MLIIMEMLVLSYTLHLSKFCVILSMQNTLNYKNVWKVFTGAYLKVHIYIAQAVCDFQLHDTELSDGCVTNSKV